MAIIHLKKPKSKIQQKPRTEGNPVAATQPLTDKQAARDDLPSGQTSPKPTLPQRSGTKMRTKKAPCSQESINEPLLTIKEAAEKLRLSPKFIYRAIEAGELGCHRFGKAIRVSASDLARFIQRCRH